MMFHVSDAIREFFQVNAQLQFEIMLIFLAKLLLLNPTDTY